jgi:hypothetical protein
MHSSSKKRPIRTAWHDSWVLSAFSVAGLVACSSGEGDFDYSQTVTTALRGGQPKVILCHNGNTISVAQPAVRALLARGATLGPCSADGTGGTAGGDTGGSAGDTGTGGDTGGSAGDTGTGGNGVAGETGDGGTAGEDPIVLD